ncbi:hypothetical protein [Methylorubrum sp. Q1]|uniref:hypothetical protein n=1 Tax=Methylorubrum sp. Q1 TaxID=2562453 RepID=UPI00187D58EA|nr:hypothetical protein [Methylorubrum sp. Q1]
MSREPTPGSDRFRRPINDCERYASTLADLHLVAFVRLRLKKADRLTTGSRQSFEQDLFGYFPVYQMPIRRRQLPSDM